MASPYSLNRTGANAEPLYQKSYNRGGGNPGNFANSDRGGYNNDRGGGFGRGGGQGGGGHGGNMYQATEFDGKRLRKAIARKTVDYNSSVVNMLERRIYQNSFRDRAHLQPDIGYYIDMVPPMAMLENSSNCITTKFVRTSTNKMRTPIFCVVWTPEGRRLVTGASSGEFTLWNGLTFNFETILQAHDSAVRVMKWGRSDAWMVTADHGGYVKYWQSNMNNVKMFQAHKEPIRALSFCPTDTKFTTCSDDGTVRIWDFLRCQEERVLRGHGADVKGVDWHPTKALVVSGSKDSQQPIILWDPKSGQNLATIHAHKNTVMDVKWNQNGNWLLTASRDHLIKIFDIRNMSTEMQVFRGHKKEATCLAWHPVHESLFVSGGSDGSILFWNVGTEKEVGGMEQAHDSVVWSLDWHPLGHILASGSNDHTCKFWTRNRPGDKMRDKYNLNLMPKGHEESEYDEVDTTAAIPGFGGHQEMQASANNSNTSIPGFDDEEESPRNERKPFTKPVPKQFQEQWAGNRDRNQFNNNNQNRFQNNQRNQFQNNQRPPFHGDQQRQFNNDQRPPFHQNDQRPPFQNNQQLPPFHQNDQRPQFHPPQFQNERPFDQRPNFNDGPRPNFNNDQKPPFQPPPFMGDQPRPQFQPLPPPQMLPPQMLPPKFGSDQDLRQGGAPDIWDRPPQPNRPQEWQQGDQQQGGHWNNQRQQSDDEFNRPPKRGRYQDENQGQWNQNDQNFR